jgi:hypothetical protein
MVVLFCRLILKFPATTNYKAPTKNTAVKKVLKNLDPINFFFPFILKK